MTSDHAQSTRIAQRGGVANQSVRMVESAEMPEVAYKGQIIYLTDLDCLSIYDGDAWQNVGDDSFNVTYVQPTPPTSPNEGDHWMNTSNGQLLTWDGTDWLDAIGGDQVTNIEIAADTITATEIMAGTITADEIAADAITVDKLDANAITAKHTITGAVFRTAVAGNRIRMRDDGSGGVIEGYTGSGSEVSPTKINPGLDAGRPILQLRAGSFTATPGATILLYGDSGPADRKMTVNTKIEVAGDHTANDHYSTNQTGGAAQDAEIGASGLIKRKVSSRRYKDDIEDLELDVHQALKLRPRQYKDKATGTKGAGFIAEEAAELGLDRWVGLRSEDRKPESFHYPEWTAVLQKVCQQQQREINELKHRIGVLEKQVGRKP